MALSQVGRWVVAALVVAVGLLVPPSASSSVAEAATGSLRGTVTAAVGGPAAGVVVVATDTAMETRLFEATTDAAGHYVIEGVTAGTYVVQFQGYPADLQSEWYLDAPTEYAATRVVVASGQARTGIDATLAAPSLLTGDVTDRDSGAPVPYARVLLFEKPGAYWQPTRFDTYTDAEGHYELAGVFGSYRILVLDGYEGTHHPTHYPGVLDVEDAETVEIPQGGERTADVPMLGRAQVSGTARAAGRSVADVSVSVTYWHDGAWRYWTSIELGEAGTWAVTLPTPFTYRVQYTDQQRRYADQWWDGQESEATATSIGLDVGGVGASGIDADLEALPAMQNTALPTVTGAPVVGQVLTAGTGRWLPEPDPSLTRHRWLADGEPLSGFSLDRQYVVKASDVGKRLSVRVGASAPGYARTWVTSAETAVVTTGTTPTESPSPTETPEPPAPLIIGPVAVGPVPLAVESRPRVRGQVRVGETLRVTPGTWSTTTGVSFTYRWLADGRRIRGATHRRLVLAPRVAGARISVRVVARRESVPPVRVRTRPTAPVRP